MYVVKLGGMLQKGDLIGICYNNNFAVGIYYGRGRGTVQYYTPNGVIYTKKRYDEASQVNRKGEEKKPFSLKNIWKVYINSPRDTRIIKLNRDNFTEIEQIQEIEKAKEILKEIGITINF